MTAQLETALKAVEAEIEQLRTRLSEGVASDTEVLDPLLISFMATLHATPVPEAKPYTEKLYALAQSLGELQTDFKRQQNGAELALQEINTRLKAATAYAKSSSTDKR
jgi:hypothetical protein